MSARKTGGRRVGSGLDLYEKAITEYEQDYRDRWQTSLASLRTAPAGAVTEDDDDVAGVHLPGKLLSCPE